MLSKIHYLVLLWLCMMSASSGESTATFGDIPSDVLRSTLLPHLPTPGNEYSNGQYRNTMNIMSTVNKHINSTVLSTDGEEQALRRNVSYTTLFRDHSGFGFFHNSKYVELYIRNKCDICLCDLPLNVAPLVTALSDDRITKDFGVLIRSSYTQSLLLQKHNKEIREARFKLLPESQKLKSVDRIVVFADLNSQMQVRLVQNSFGATATSSNKIKCETRTTESMTWSECPKNGDNSYFPPWLKIVPTEKFSTTIWNSTRLVVFSGAHSTGAYLDLQTWKWNPLPPLDHLVTSTFVKHHGKEKQQLLAYSRHSKALYGLVKTQDTWKIVENYSNNDLLSSLSSIPIASIRTGLLLALSLQKDLA